MTEETKKHGGSRSGAGRKSKQIDPSTRAEWLLKLERAIVMASGNMCVLKKNAFWTQKEIRAKWGVSAVSQFKHWFEASKHYNQEIADGLLHEFESGKIDEAKYKKLLATQAYTWIWSIKSERRKEAWQISRKLKELE